jgi:23S rRNA (cytosine1962-C5)-methyltransferase
MPGLTIKPTARIHQGHEWVYAGEVLRTFGQPQDGDVVQLLGHRGAALGTAIYNSKSAIVARRFSRRKAQLDAEFFIERLKLARDFRARHGLDPRLSRLVWSESDGLPGVIVDRYGDYLVLQTLTAAMDQRRALLVEALIQVFQPAGIIERNDSPIRLAEGLELRTSVPFGSMPPPFAIEVAGLKIEVDLARGHKTGFYLDQLANYAPVAAHAAGRRVLDCFSHTGAFALACARAGASEVHAIELNAECAAQIERHATHNGLQVQVATANVFDHFKTLGQRGEKFDLIILDPPSFTKSKDKLTEARRGYKEIHLRALGLLNPLGRLATFSCSHHVSAAMLLEVINEAAVDAKKTLCRLGQFSQGLDHPIIPTIPETEYLKGFLFELAPDR